MSPSLSLSYSARSRSTSSHNSGVGWKTCSSLGFYWFTVATTVTCRSIETSVLGTPRAFNSFTQEQCFEQPPCTLYLPPYVLYVHRLYKMQAQRHLANAALLRSVNMSSKSSRSISFKSHALSVGREARSESCLGGALDNQL